VPEMMMMMMICGGGDDDDDNVDAYRLFYIHVLCKPELFLKCMKYVITAVA
jgi:hypothetical protein